MKKSFEIPYEVLSEHELRPDFVELVAAALKALQYVHAPYSQFHVGSAVRLADGTIQFGSNQENAAYPSGLCAERVALFKSKSESALPIKTILVLAQNAAGDLADSFSCGNCRQVMLEYASLQSSPIEILMRTATGSFIYLDDIRKLMPFSFESTTLK